MNQSLKNIEIIVVNDCSPDNSEAIVLEYAAKDDRIVYIKHEENKCLGGARNTGIKAARGKYIAFVDSDDFVDTHLYETAIKAFEKHKIDLVVFPAKIFVKKGKTLDIFHEYHDGIYDMRLNADTLALSFHFPASWNKVYKTKDLHMHKLCFPEHTLWEDNEFFLSYCALVTPKVLDLPKKGPGYHYRRRAQSITSTLSHTVTTGPFAFLRAYKVLEKTGYLKELYSEIYLHASQGLGDSWNTIDPSYIDKFKRNCLDFLRQVHCAQDQKLTAPEWYLISILSDKDQMLMLDVYLERWAAIRRLRHSKWHQFGKLPALIKIKKLVFTVFKKIWRKALFY